VEVGDVIYTPPLAEGSGSHVEIVTAVERDREGRVISVRVEESTPPTTTTTIHTPDRFDSHLAARSKQLLRVNDPDTWRGGNRGEFHHFPNHAADAAAPSINRALLLDLGDWVPYRKGQPVRFNVMDRDGLGVQPLVIRRDGE